MRANTLLRLVAATLAAALTVVVATTEQAAANPTDTQRRVDAELAAHPGGVQINATEIAYQGGLTVTVTRPASTAPDKADCPNDAFCFYELTDYGYPRGRLASCGWQDLARWNWQDRTESVHYNFGIGSVTFINHAGGTTHGNDVPLFTAHARQAIANLGANRNIADHVYHNCTNT